jgi:SAM-dependent methyltransferase
MGNHTAFNQDKAAAFAGKAMSDASSAAVMVMAYLGDRLHLFKAMAGCGPVSSTELAAQANVDARYAQEWLSAMACAGYVEYDPSSATFILPPEHVPVLAQEAGPYFMGGLYQDLMGAIEPIDQVARAFKAGGGVPQSAFGDKAWCGLDRMTSAWYENFLLQLWIPSVPAVEAKLQQGGAVAALTSVADVGCGFGRALVKLAQAFPNSQYVGYDIHDPMIEHASALAQEAGVADRVRFEQRDAAQGLPGQYDLITSFDVLHDMVDPRAALRAIRQALKPDGTYLLLEINCSEKLEENAGPIGAILYSISVLYCMSVSLAHGGAGLGTCGLPPSKVEDYCREAGFSHVRRLPFESPLNILYEVNP